MSEIELLPCPFCGGAIDVPGSSITRDIKTARHPSNDCILSGQNWWMVPRFIEPWNRRTDLSQAAVAAALEAAAVIAETHQVYQAHVCAARIRAQITQPQHDALAAHVAAEVAKARADERDAANARADQARDDALGEAADIILAENYDDPDSAAHAILALRDKPAPGVTPKIEVKFTWAKGDEEFWVHLKSPDGKSAGFNLGNPKGMIATALLRAIAGGEA